MRISSRILLLVMSNHLMLNSELPLWKCSCEHTLGVTINKFFISPLGIPPNRVEVRPRNHLSLRLMSVMLSKSTVFVRKLINL